MANPTTYFGWVMPTSSSLVTNLPADFNTFGQGVDTSLQYLLGGTTGQVLSKTSGTNMAFTWVTPTDQTPLTTKGDLFAFSTVDARLAVGANETRLVADSTQTVGLKYVADTTNYAINAKADLLVGTAADTLAALTVGTNGQVLTADSTVSPTGLKWATPSGGGKVLQVINAVTTTEIGNSTNVFADVTGLTATITPTLNTSKILVLVSANGLYKSNGNADNAVQLRLVRGSTTIVQMAGTQSWANAANFNTTAASTGYLDSPATTSATTYKVQFCNYPNSASVVVNLTLGSNLTSSTITLLEIGA
jgi:hypothetical protein